MSCDDVITLKQYGGTCWFNSLLTCILYSDESRKLLLEKSKTWDTSIPIFDSISFILKNKYFRTTDKHDDYKYFEVMKPEKILSQLNDLNRKKFIFDPKINNGYNPELYIRKVYKLLGVKVLYLDYAEQDNKFYYSLFNNLTIKKRGKSLNYDVVKYKDRTIIDELINNHDILIIKVLDNKLVEQRKRETSMFKYPPHYLITDKIINEIDTITFKNQKYNQDSVMISNSNSSLGGHSIAGIKCKGIKHVYNGWTRKTIDPALGKLIIEEDGKIAIPCEYMRFEWKTDKKNEFVLDPFTCSLANKTVVLPIKKFVFSFNTLDRVMIYTKIIEKSPPIVVPVQPVKPPVYIDVNIPEALPDGLSIGYISTLQAIIRRKLAMESKKLTDEATTLQAVVRRKLASKVPTDEATTLQAVVRRKLASKVPTDEATTLQAIIRRKLASKVPKNEATTLQAIIRRKIMKKPEPKSTPITKPSKPPKPPKTPKTPKTPKIKICKEGSTLNTLSNRCNKNCTILQEKNPETGRCRKLCTDLQERNADTGRCKKIKVPKIYKI